jgi:Domain of unknown function (DUF4267)
MSESQTRDEWSMTSPSFLAASGLAAFMAFLGVRGLLAPRAAAEGFGLSLASPRDRVWLRIKGGRDLAAALAIGGFLALRQPRALGAMLLANLVSPSVDLLTSLTAPRHKTGYALGVHGGAAAAVGMLGIALLRRQRRSGRSPATR